MRGSQSPDSPKRAFSGTSKVSTKKTGLVDHRPIDSLPEDGPIDILLHASAVVEHQSSQTDAVDEHEGP